MDADYSHWIGKRQEVWDVLEPARSNALRAALGNGEALDAGVWQILSKPVDFSRLLPLVEEAVQQPLVRQPVSLRGPLLRPPRPTRSPVRAPRRSRPGRR